MRSHFSKDKFSSLFTSVSKKAQTNFSVWAHNTLNRLLVNYQLLMGELAGALCDNHIKAGLLYPG